ncbi:MAG: Asp-tRNA(Asn)/Glu-tRNA(Gln) amidotransferase subunit GatC [Rickettsiales bacterium]|jgi:aspartyl-tRNA(Asn)/glutamyl-tRNA(Gln) amidotransferase subunit C|nr:Asp-tRNA(Asn)/Glu-tRNA(Gln) amidotransferase subunit GatC [Rickettsiales bacterium]
MYFTPEIVRQNARLVRIGLTDDMAKKMAEDLDGIIGWIEQIDEIDVEGMEPLITTADFDLPLREDRVKAENTADEILAGAPDRAGEYMAVPKIIE